MEYLEPRALYEYVQQRSLTHMAYPDIYMRIACLCIRAYHHQSVRTFGYSLNYGCSKGLGLPSGIIVTLSPQ